MERGDFVRVKSTGQQGILEYEAQPYTSIFNGQIISGFTVPTVMILEGDELKHISAAEDDLEVIE